jgi:ribonuclease BN (tRNA processing enzyme)
MSDELIVLGSASSVPSRRRFPSAYALTVAGNLFLIDCGAPVSTLLYRYELDPMDVHTVFLSHWHMDHVASLGLLLTQNHLRKRSKTLNIYGPRGTKGKIKRLLNDAFFLADDLRYDLSLTNIKPDTVYKEALLRVTFFKTDHLNKPRQKTNFGPRAIACGLVLDGPGWRIVYSGDLTSSTELTSYVEACDLLIHEVSGHRLEAIAEFAAAAKIPYLLLSHIGPELDETPERIVAACAGHYDGQLIVAEDGTRVSLNEIALRKKQIDLPAESEADFSGFLPVTSAQSGEEAPV